MRRWVDRVQVPSIVCGVFVSLALTACADCDRAGCEAVRRAAEPNGTGVAGVVAALSDQVTDGCAECPIGQGTVEIWRVDAPVETDGDAVRLLTARQPDVVTEADGRFQQALEPGSYLLCSRPNCVGFDVAAGETTTVNIERRDGPTSFFVRDPGSETLEKNFGLDVGY